MARKSSRKRAGVNKSQAIRDYLAKHGNAMPKQIKADLAADGIDVSSALISSVKYGEKKTTGNGRRKGRKKMGRKVRTGRNSITIADLMQAKQLADQLGGVDRVKKAIETLEKLK